MYTMETLCTLYVIHVCMLDTCQEKDDCPVKGPSYTALYDFKGQDATQLNITKGETVRHMINVYVLFLPCSRATRSIVAWERG